MSVFCFSLGIGASPSDFWQLNDGYCSKKEILWPGLVEWVRAGRLGRNLRMNFKALFL
jgi:hypothetical protein